MFGIGLPEMILILALALIVVGPEKLPELARSLAKGVLELKKTAEGLKEQLKEEASLIDEVRPELEEAAKNLKSHMLNHPEKGNSSLFADEEESSLPATDEASAAYKELAEQGIDPAEAGPLPTADEADGITGAPRMQPPPPAGSEADDTKSDSDQAASGK